MSLSYLMVHCYVSFSVQVPFLFVSKLKDVSLPASPNTSAKLNCIAKFSTQRPPAYKWSKDGTVLSGTSSSITITYSSATDVYNNYRCTRNSISSREVHCSATYKCSVSLPGLRLKGKTKGNVNVTLSK